MWNYLIYVLSRPSRKALCLLVPNLIFHLCSYVPYPRNADVVINLRGEFKARKDAMMSVFDVGFMMDDEVWEGLRIYNDVIAFWDEYAARLREGLMALNIDLGITMPKWKARIHETLDANEMDDGVHIRLMVPGPQVDALSRPCVHGNISARARKHIYRCMKKPEN